MKGSSALSNVLVAVAFLGGALFAIADAVAENPDHDTPVLVRLKPDPNAVWLTARLDGALQVRNGCVYIVAKQSEESAIAIWPSSYRLLKSKGKAEGVIDSLTGHSVKFGVETSFGGGEARHVTTAMLDAKIPSTCNGKRSFVYFSKD